MRIVKPVLLAVLLSSALFHGMALATEPPPRVGATPLVQGEAGRAAPKADASKKKPQQKRRAVYQVFDGMPGTAPPVGVQPLPSPSPLAPPASMTAVPGPTTFLPSGCHGAACSDPAGNRYQGGVGTTLIGPQGRLCSNNGITVQCF